MFRYVLVTAALAVVACSSFQIANGESAPATGLLERAQSGDAEAQYDIGMRFLENMRTSDERTQGIYWLELASAQGHLEARFELGSLLLYSGNEAREIRRGIGLLQELGRNFHARSLKTLALAYFHGSNVRIDMPRALFYADLSTTAGSRSANSCLDDFMDRLLESKGSNESAASELEYCKALSAESAEMRGTLLALMDRATEYEFERSRELMDQFVLSNAYPDPLLDQ